MRRQFGQKLPRTKRKDTAIPGKTAAGQKLLRFCKIGLFDKFLHRKAALQRVAPLNIAIASLWSVGLNAKRHQPIVPRQFGRGLGRLLESLRVGDMMIAWAHQHNIVRIQDRRRQSNRGRRVAGHRLNHQRIGVLSTQLLFDQGDMVRARHNHRISKNVRTVATLQSLFEQAG